MKPSLEKGKLLCKHKSPEERAREKRGSRQKPDDRVSLGK